VKTTKNILFYAYMATTTGFILHEMDAVYWKEWELFGITRDYPGLMVFILAHVLILPAVFWGMANLHRRQGLMISLVMACFGMAHFFLHAVLGKGYFVTGFSSGIINAIFIVSAAQLYLTIKLLKQKEAGAQ